MGIKIFRLIQWQKFLFKNYSCWPRDLAQPARAAPAVSDDSLMNSRLFIFISLFPALAVIPIVSYLTDTHKQNLGFKD